MIAYRYGDSVTVGDLAKEQFWLEWKAEAAGIDVMIAAWNGESTDYAEEVERYWRQELEEHNEHGTAYLAWRC